MKTFLSRENYIVQFLDYQIPITQLVEKFNIHFGLSIQIGKKKIIR